MTYAEALDFLQSLQLFAANFGLETTRRLAALAGNPQSKLRFIHVAGTNGKGSTCAMLESIYRQAGLRVGLYTSPHLVSFRERIQVNRELIPEAALTRLVADLRDKNHGEPVTLFEFTTVLALAWFAEQRCDVVIWETGLGGRLDATNIVNPLASVITNIAFDHEQWLGDTLPKIAAEKAGIIKPGVPVLTAATQPEVLEVIAAVAQKNAAPLIQVGSAPAPGAVFRALAENIVRAGESASCALPHPDGLPDAGAHPATPGAGVLPAASEIGLIGHHQKTNAALAVATAGVLQNIIPVSPENIRAGLASVHWPGRLQVIPQPGGKIILLDGAHNAAGAEVLRMTLENEFAGRPPTIIFGSLADKQWPKICQTLAPLAVRILTVPVASKRTANPGELAAAFRAAHPAANATPCENLADALNASKDSGFIVITGSLYLIGEALDLLGCAVAGASERGLNEWSGGSRTG